MSFADDIKPLLHSIRSIPGQMGLRPYSVSVVRRSFSGTYPGEGTETETVTAITESGGYSPKVRFLDDEEIALGGTPKGTAEIGPITPDFTGGGTALSTLLQTAASEGDLVLFRLTGPGGTLDYKIVESTDHKSLHYLIRVKPVGAES